MSNVVLLALSILASPQSCEEENVGTPARIRPALVIPGVSMFGTAYALAALFGGAAGPSSLYVPLFGPFIFVANRDDFEDFGWGHGVVAVFDGLVQIAGFALTIWGLIGNEPPEDPTPPCADLARAPPSWW